MSQRQSVRRRKRPVKAPVLPLLAVAAVLLLGVAVVCRSRSAVRGHRAPPELPDWVQTDLLPVSEYARPGLRLETVNGVVVHYVGNPGTTAAQNRSYFNSLAETHETKASAHFIIGLEGEVIQCIPLDEISYCSNDRNRDTISIECCHPGEDGAFTQATYDALTKLTRFLVRAYGLKEGEVIRHYDVTGKLCPLYYVEHPDAWEAFLKEVFR